MSRDGEGGGVRTEKNFSENTDDKIFSGPVNRLYDHDIRSKKTNKRVLP